MMKQKPIPPTHPLERAAFDSGGKLIRLQFRNIALDIKRFAPGCGCPTHVSGTNGGTMPCGAKLTAFGKTEQYFCAACTPLPVQEGFPLPF